jgi:NitT/TauT family transport system ATP-binding protein
MPNLAVQKAALDENRPAAGDLEQVLGVPYLHLDSVSKSYGALGAHPVHAIARADLVVWEKEFVAVVGPSGCGKSTLLQIAAGLIPATEGRVMLNGRPVVRPPPEMVYLFQQYSKSLLPWRTVVANVAFALERRPDLSKHAVNELAMHHLDLVDLAPFALNYPSQLSGGMQQRVAIARALAAEPRVLLLDEPFSSVDALTRLELHDLLLDLCAKHGLTVLLVTHDVDEAVYLADRVAMLTPRPSSIAEVMTVDLPRPRHAIKTRELERFLYVRHHLLAQLLSSRHESA